MVDAYVCIVLESVVKTSISDAGASHQQEHQDAARSNSKQYYMSLYAAADVKIQQLASIYDMPSAAYHAVKGQDEASLGIVLCGRAVTSVTPALQVLEAVVGEMEHCRLV